MDVSFRWSHSAGHLRRFQIGDARIRNCSRLQPLKVPHVLDAESGDGVTPQQKFPTSYPTSTAPPFTLKTSPVIKPAYSVHKNSTGAAISSGLPARPSGIVPRIASPVLGSSSAGFDISVSTQPGATLFT